jgi:hypothetical protein
LAATRELARNQPSKGADAKSTANSLADNQVQR